MAQVTEQGLARIGGMLQQNQKRITAKLGSMINWEYFCSAALTMIEKNAALAKCSDASLIRAMLDAAQLRLIPDGVLGEAYLVPYGPSAVLVPGYKGLIQLCLRSGLVRKIGARVVYKNDFFDYEYGMDEKCTHRPTEDDPGEMRGVYGIFEMADGVKGFEYWPYKKLMNHKLKFAKGLTKKDKSGNFTSPWVTNEESMCLKTVIRSITKNLPKSVEDISKLNAIEDRMEMGLDLSDGAIDVDVSDAEESGDNGLASITKDLEGKNGSGAGGEDDIPLDEIAMTPYEKNKAFVIAHLEEKSPDSSESRAKLLRSYVELSKIEMNANALALMDLPTELKSTDLAILAEFIEAEILTTA